MATECKQCGDNNCSHIIVKSTNQRITITIPYIITHQGRREFGSGSISAEDLLCIADIPALDFSLEFNEFCKKTDQFLNDFQNTGIKPHQWQRPTSVERIVKAALWLGGPADNSMPDGILIGQRELESSYLRNTPHSIIGNYQILQLEITNNLLSSCPICGTFQDEDGNQRYQNRCSTHTCPHHLTTTSPFNIIDGQHRTMSIFNSNLELKQINVSILLQHAQSDGYIGYDSADQAKIFNQVNTENSELDKLHKTWLKRFFGEWANNSSNASDAFDLLARLGMTPSGAVNTSWPPYIKFHPKSGKARIDSNRSTDAGTGTIGGLSSMESIMDELNNASLVSGRTEYAIMIDFLNAAVTAFPNQFTLPTTVGFLDTIRPFEAFLRLFNKIKIHSTVNTSFSGTFNYNDFLWTLAQHSTSFGSNDWQKYADSGEKSWMEFYNILKLMWPTGAGYFLPSRPDWFTVYGGGSNACPDWLSYIALTPDPLDGFSDVTYCDQDCVIDPNGPLASTNTRATKLPTDTVSWNRPRNIASTPQIFYRVYNNAGIPGQWLNHQGGVTTSPVTDDIRDTTLILNRARELEKAIDTRNNVMWDIKIVYSNCTGETSLVVGYITS